MYKEFSHIKEKGKCEEDDIILNELYLGNHRAKAFSNFIETDNYIYYLSGDDSKLLVRVNKDSSDSYFIILGFNNEKDEKVKPTSHAKIIVDTNAAKISMFGELHQKKPVIESTYDLYTSTWDVRSNLDRDNKPSNLKKALEEYKRKDPIHGTNLEETIIFANKLFKDIRINSQKRKQLSPKSYN